MQRELKHSSDISLIAFLPSFLLILLIYSRDLHSESLFDEHAKGINATDASIIILNNLFVFNDEITKI